VHGLLRHLEAVDFPAPRLLDVDEQQGVEILSWIEGESGANGWQYVVPEEGLRAYAHFVRGLHDALRGYDAPPDSEWSRGPGGGFVCHGDPGPWNMVFRDGQPFAFIDFDHAHAGTPLDDIVYALEFVAPFRDDDWCLEWGRYAEPPRRGRRIELFCDAYGIHVPADIRKLVHDRQVADTALVRALADQGMHPQVTWVRSGWMDEERARAAWSLSAPLD
jgi:hypothetical protein